MREYVDQGHWVGAMPSRPKGLLLHGSRSGVPSTIKQEFDRTREYARNSYIAAGDYYTGWHATIGEDEYSIHMEPDVYGWNVRSESSQWIAFEFAQWDVRQAITDAQIRAAAAYFKKHVTPRWGTWDWSNPMSLQTHAERPPGIKDGKTDVAPLGSEMARNIKLRMKLALQAVGA